MTSPFSSCFGHSKQPPSCVSSQEEHLNDASATPASRRAIDGIDAAKCVFCNVTPDRFRIVIEDEKLICFTDRSPGAAIHLLVIPRNHIANVQSLTHNHTELVRQMQALGNKALDLVSSSNCAPERRFGFHIPPIRSVDHLHLHCLELPFKSQWKAIKYRLAEPPNHNYIKGWSWFVEWQQTCALLNAGRKIKISSC